MDTNDDVAQAFRVWHHNQSRNPNVLRSEGVELHKGAHVYKSASLRVFKDRENGTVHGTELRVGTYPGKEFEPGYDFERPDRTWACEDDQIDRVRALLDGAFPEPGFYIRVQKGTNVGGLIEALADGQVDVASIAELVQALAAVPGVTDALAGTDLAKMFSSVVERSRQQAGLDRLRVAVEDPTSSEQDLQSILEEHWWVFGSRYVGASTRRKLTLLDQLDIPLIRADGALHVVELKKAHYPRLLVPHRNHVALGPEVHLAVSQAQNYLAALDRQESVIRDELGLDCRRAFTTVVIGHSMHCSDYSRADVSEALRIYNSHLSRIEVITYEDLLAGAEWALEITHADVDNASSPAEAPGRVLADLAVMIADGGDALTHLATLRDQSKLFGAVASEPTAWRAVDRVDDAHLSELRAVRATARERAWVAGAGPDVSAGLVIDLDATITIAHSEKVSAAKTWKKTFGFHPLLAYLDRPEVAGGKRWPGCCGRATPGRTPPRTTSR